MRRVGRLVDKMRQSSDVAPTEFADLLRLYRTAAGLTQEELAERAGVTVQCVSTLERGLRRRPRRETVTMLAKGLALASPQREAFDRAAVHPKTPPLPSHAPALSRESQLSVFPQEPNTLIGREGDLEQVKTMLCREKTRLVTIMGPGGVGKTRLALAVARDLADGFADGVVFVPLATVRDESLVASAIMQALGLKGGPGWPSRSMLGDRLRDAHLLLVLDNLEHLPSCGALVGELLATCARLRIVATSRSALRLRAEQRWLLRPLATTAPPDPIDLAALARTPALALLLDRARAADEAFALTLENAAPLAEICRRLDGLPLALELAAPRLRILSPAQLLIHLSSKLDMLTHGAADLPERQRTLRTTLAWSYDLLGRDEAAMFRRLAVFAGGFTLHAVESICGDARVTGIDIDLAASLVDNSLLYRDDRGGEQPRLTMLETIHKYARELLDVSPERDAVRARHATFFCSAVFEAETHLLGPEQALWRARLDLDYGNICVALLWLQERDAIEDALRLAAALWRYWQLRGAASEGRAWLEGLLDRDRDTGRRASKETRVRALGAAARLAYLQDDYEKVTSRVEEVLMLCPQGDYSQLRADSLNTLGNMYMAKGEYARAEESFEESLFLQRAVGYEWGTAMALHNLGVLATRRERYDEAKALHYESLALFRVIEDVRGVGESLYRLATLAWLRDEPDALTLANEAVVRLDDLRDQAVRPRARLTLALILFDEGSDRGAWMHAREALAILRETGDKAATALALEIAALLTASDGKSTAALRLLGAAEALREAIGAPPTAIESLVHERTLTSIHGRLRDEVVTKDAWTEGRTLGVYGAIGRALATPLQDP